ncbi:MAG: hypothetical protein GY953_37690, partial [bacterium]|nr:hypothetical protein [bacterium]
LGAAPLAHAAFWHKKQFPNWSQRDVDRMLTDSPWAKSTSVSIELRPRRVNHLASAFSDIGLPRGTGWPGGLGWPGGGGGSRVPTSRPGPGQGSSVPPVVTRGEAYLTVRWSSALPIRQAALLDRHGSLEAAPAEEVEALHTQPGDYILEIFGIPAQVIQSSRKDMEESLMDTSQLTLPSRRPVRATYAHAPVHGQYRFLTLRFPRTEPITVEQKQVALFASAGPFEVQQKFKLKTMLYGGRLEL